MPYKNNIYLLQMEDGVEGEGSRGKGSRNFYGPCLRGFFKQEEGFEGIRRDNIPLIFNSLKLEEFRRGVKGNYSTYVKNF